MRTKNSGLLLVMVLAGSMSANATPVSYDEAIDGDLEWPDVLVFGFGVNTVSGTASCIPEAGCDFDQFDAVLPHSSVIESVALNLTDANGSGFFPEFFAFYRLAGGAILREDLSGAGDYFWTVGGSFASLHFIGVNGFPAGMSNDYTITFDVRPSSVPEAGTLALLGLGLAGLGMSRRRRIN